MPRFIINWWRTVDKILISLTLTLFLISALLVTTASSSLAGKLNLDQNYFIFRQLHFIVIGLILALVISNLNMKWIKIFAILGFVINVIFLVLVKFYGFEVKGARRWFNIMGFSMQPSEFIKPFFAIITAWLLSVSLQSKSFQGVLLTVFLYFIVAILIAMQPDIGMLVTISGIWCCQLFVSGMPIIWILFIGILGASSIMGAYMFFPHVASRINSFLDPDKHENYQVSKSILAFERGGWSGVGPGEGVIKQSLPDAHADFIFAVAGEEFGAIICLIITAIFAFIVIRGLFKMIFENDEFVIISVVGILSQIAIQSIINIGVTLNLLPTKGMTLPFISYGGSSTLALSIGVGMLIALTRRRANITKYRNNIMNSV